MPTLRPAPVVMVLFLLSTPMLRAAPLAGSVVDADSGEPLPCRLYLEGPDGARHFVQSAAAAGWAVEYERRRGNPPVAWEKHTTLSAHGFRAELPPGRYRVRAVRGKEYLEAETWVDLGEEGGRVRLELRRWVDLPSRGWWSGDTHVHLAPEVLRRVQLAEDLHVAFPLTYWVTKAYEKPSQGGKNVPDPLPPEWVRLDDRHAFFPRNTEYEIFTVDGKRHPLGAFFVLRHRTVLQRGVPPVGPVIRQMQKEGALFELDKHNWPWSMMLVPHLEPVLYELSNNHIWRTRFAFTDWGEPAGDYMGVDFDGVRGTERGWVEYGFKNFYALLNAGLRVLPTAGTAHGVHPVPLGFGRVYVRTGRPGKGEGLDPEAWLKALAAGRSFVTTGPMLFVTVNGAEAGTVLSTSRNANRPTVRMAGEIAAVEPVDRVEVIWNGKVVAQFRPVMEKRATGGWEGRFEWERSLDQGGWLAVRAWRELPGGRFRFAHTGVWRIEGLPAAPQPTAEKAWLIDRVQSQMERNQGVLSAESLAEYEAALERFRQGPGNETGAAP